jgi:hypothetical protein
MPNDDLHIQPPPFLPISLAMLAAAAGVDPDKVRELYQASKERVRSTVGAPFLDPAKPHLWN